MSQITQMNTDPSLFSSASIGAICLIVGQKMFSYLRRNGHRIGLA